MGAERRGEGERGRRSGNIERGGGREGGRERGGGGVGTERGGGEGEEEWEQREGEGGG